VRAKSNLFFLLLALVVMMLLSGCGYHYKCAVTFGGSSCTPSGGGIGGGGGGNGGGGASTSALVYYADDNLGQINAIGLDSSSNFLPVANYTPPTFTADIDGGMQIVNSKFLYLPVVIAGEVLEYSISHPSGALTPVVGGPFVGPVGAGGIATDPAGKFLFVADGNGFGIWAFTINQTTGALSNAPGSPFSYTGPTLERLTVDGNGKFLYGAGFAQSQIVGFSIDQNTGALTVIAGSPFSATVQDVKAEASGKFLLGVHGSTGVNGTVIDNHIYVFGIDQVTGAISQVSGSPFTTVSAPFGLEVSPNGKFVYTFNGNPTGGIDALEGYAIDSTTGALSAVAGSPFTGLLGFPGTGRFEETGTEFFGHPDFAINVLNANTSTGTMTQTITGQSISSNFAFAVTDN
jgi:lactonase family protein with 7-bladed beta-propeller